MDRWYYRVVKTTNKIFKVVDFVTRKILIAQVFQTITQMEMPKKRDSRYRTSFYRDLPCSKILFKWKYNKLKPSITLDNTEGFLERNKEEELFIKID